MLSSLQDALLRALRADDPLAALERLSAELSEEDRAALAHVQPAGLRMTRLLLANLRFERLVRSSPAYRERFWAEPETVTREFQRYHREVEPRAWFPAEELRLYQASLE